MRIRVLVENEKYVRDEVYLSNVLRYLEWAHDVFIEDYSTSSRVSQSVDVTLSMIRIRNLLKYADQIGQDPIIVNDYDPWCSLAIDQPYTGLYDLIWKRLNIQAFLVSSYEWCKISRDMGYPTAWYRIGVQAKDCDHGNRFWNSRSIDLEFRGSRHDFRVKAFDNLARAGLTVPWPANKVPLSQFGDHLRNVRVWAHDESLKFRTIRGEYVNSNWLWPKTCEVLARGCFVVRDEQMEMYHYDLDSIPTLITYRGIENARSAYESILAMSPSERDSRIDHAVARMRHADPYRTFAEEFEKIVSDTR
jgi:hypothetical protein